MDQFYSNISQSIWGKLPKFAAKSRKNFKMDDKKDIMAAPFFYENEDMLLTNDPSRLAAVRTSGMHHYILIFCQQGQMTFHVNGKEHSLNAPQVATLAPKNVVERFLLSPDIKQVVLCISNEQMHRLLQKNIEEWDSSIYVEGNYILETKDEETERIVRWMHDLFEQMQMSENGYRREIKLSLIRCILFELLGVMHDAQPRLGGQVIDSHGNTLFKNFLLLLASRKQKHAPVATYAAELCIGSQYLSQVCRRVSGKSAIEWIHDFTDEDIRWNLKNTDRSVKEVSDILGFADLSSFGKYVRQRFGCSPTALKQKQ
jgi:AraC-like DNA-binding protein